MRFVFVLIILISSFIVSAQEGYYFGGGMGFSSKDYFKAEALFGKDKVLVKFGIDSKRNNGTKGQYYSNINWDQFPTDVVSEGRYTDFVNLGFDYFIIKELNLGFSLGFGKEVKYRNCFDNFHILGDNGEYYKEIYTGNKPTNIMFDANYSYFSENNPFALNLGVSYGSLTGVGFNMGFFLVLKGSDYKPTKLENLKNLFYQ